MACDRQPKRLGAEELHLHQRHQRRVDRQRRLHRKLRRNHAGDDQDAMQKELVLGPRLVPNAFVEHIATGRHREEEQEQEQQGGVAVIPANTLGVGAAFDHPHQLALRAAEASAKHVAHAAVVGGLQRADDACLLTSKLQFTTAFRCIKCALLFNLGIVLVVVLIVVRVVVLFVLFFSLSVIILVLPSAIFVPVELVLLILLGIVAGILQGGLRLKQTGSTEQHMRLVGALDVQGFVGMLRVCQINLEPCLHLGNAFASQARLIDHCRAGQDEGIARNKIRLAVVVFVLGIGVGVGVAGLVRVTPIRPARVLQAQGDQVPGQEILA
mmetsp:Transcript_4844/g.19378  ORF Transcript_4844/g.19378 Transcript_4844/m.19378 type:complete len:326 (+) Transcript_4844:3018-3995(+)